MQPLEALVLYNSASPGWEEARTRVLPYLDHFGVPCRNINLLRDPLPDNVDRCPSIILAHPGIDPTLARLGPGGLSRLRDAIASGTGLVCFDPALSALMLDGQASGGTPEQVDRLEISSASHFVTRLHDGRQTYNLRQAIDLPPVPGEPLLAAGQHALLAAAPLEHGRVLTWASTAWMDPAVLGPLSGLDDLFWRGLAWVARGPFCIRGLPPLVTVRVDDVAGTGGLWDQSPLYWAEEAAQAGFKPWMGLFIYNLTPPTAAQLRGMVLSGQATAFPHAFGRPPRQSQGLLPAQSGPREQAVHSFFYDQNALPLRADSYDEFIYFDHHHGVPWSDSEAAHGLDAVDRWYAAHSPLPMSQVALAHWYEMGSNTLPHVYDRWGAHLMGKIMDVDLPLAPGTPWLNTGPFRRLTHGDAFPFTPGSTGQRPVYYSDFFQASGRQFFNSITEIRDDAGYEWAPDNDVTATIARGVRQLRRAVDSMALASLFTHETDFIYKIRPENWAEIIRGIAREIAGENPIQVTLDEGIRYLRAVKSSTLLAAYDDQQDKVILTFTGECDVPTRVLLFDENQEEGHWVDVPAFSGRQEVNVKL